MFNSNNGTQFTMPVVPAGNSYGNGAFGDSGWFIWIILILAIFGGWGYGNGNWGGFGGGQSTSVYEGYVLNNDFSVLSNQMSQGFASQERKLDSISNGICSLGYDQLAPMNGTNTHIITAVNTLQGAVKDCCCQTQQNLADVKYTIGSTGADISRGVERGFSDTNFNISTLANGITNTITNGFCQTNFNAQTNTRDIVDSQNAGTQAILAKLNDMETERLREKLESERDAKYALQGQLDRAELRTAIVNDVRPCPIPAYPACNPWGCNCNQGCGC